MLKDKVAIITGSAKGIGRGITLALAKEGCQIVISDIDGEKCQEVVEEIIEINQKAITIECDVSKKEEVDNLIAETIKQFGKIDILVNNAGIFPFKPFLEITEEEWDKVLNVNLKSIFLCSQAAVKVMKEGSKIINISSIAAFIGYAGLTHYCASKGGINGFVRALALELAPKKINVNAVAPGAIDTPGANAFSSEDIRKQTITAIPWARIGQPEDIANIVVFLASDRADYITGQTIIVDGGYTLK